jgi:predicted nucleic acid-binding protein
MFVDSNIFLHAFLIPRRPLTEEEQHVKEEAKAVVKRVEEGEGVATTTVHLSEVINIIESGLGLKKSLGFLAWVITCKNIKVYPVATEDYETALPLAEEKNISANDALAYFSMKTHGLKEIYSTDKHFEKLEDVVRLTKKPLK